MHYKEYSQIRSRLGLSLSLYIVASRYVVAGWLDLGLDSCSGVYGWVRVSPCVFSLIILRCWCVSVSDTGWC